MIIDIVTSLGIAYLAYHTSSGSKATRKCRPIVTIVAGVATWYILQFLRVIENPERFQSAPVITIEQGDSTLRNLYRQLHHLDATQRAEVFQFNDALAGGTHNIPAEPYIGEAYDREMSKIKQTILADIAATRRGYNELLDTPTKPVFHSAGRGDDRILGIPSQIGTLPYYY